MTHKVARTNEQRRGRLIDRRPTTLTQLNAEYVSRINNLVELDRDDLARELAANFDTDRRHLPHP